MIVCDKLRQVVCMRPGHCVPGFLLRPIDGAFRVWYIVFMIIYVPSHDKGGRNAKVRRYVYS